MSASVFPAYVGMSPGTTTPSNTAQRVPRIRGDEPQGDTEFMVTDGCSPHTWG